MPLRDHFPILEHKTYLNSCSQGALSREVQAAYATYLQDWQEKGSPWELWVELNEAARQAFAGLVNAGVDEVAVTTSVSAAVSAIASSLDFSGERNKIIVTDFAFPTTAQIWHAQESRGAVVRHVRAEGNRVPLARLAEAIDDRTKLVSIAHVCYWNGARQDVAAIAGLAQRQGALVLVDSYQALGTMPIDVKALGVDFLVGGVLKYLLASAGLAYAYIRRELIPELNPTSTGWFAQANIFAMDIYHHAPSPTARRFEAGTPPVPNVYAALAGLKLVQSVGLAEIEAHVRELTGAIKAEAAARGFNLATPLDPAQHGAMIALRARQVQTLVGRLAEAGVIVSSRADNLRISPHFYNNLADIERLMACLEQQRALLV